MTTPGQPEENPPQPAAADASSAPLSAWPARPSLTLLLVLLLCVVSAMVILGSREESQLGWPIGSKMGLGLHRVRPVPPAYKGLAYIAEGRALAVDLTTKEEAQGSAAPSGSVMAPFVPPEKPPAPIAEALERIAKENLPAEWYVVTPKSVTRAGMWAVTRQVAEIDVQRTRIRSDNGFNKGQLSDANDAVAANMENLRRAYRPFSDALANDETTSARKLLRGYVLDLATVALLILTAISLVPGHTSLVMQWDKALAFYDKVGPAALLGLLWTAAPAVLGIMLLANISPISDLLHTNKVVGWFGYVAVFMVSAGVGFLPTYGQSILGGFVFGFAWGFPGAMIGFVGGSVIGYFIAHSVAKHKVEDLLDSNPRSRAVREVLIGHGFWRTLGIVTLIRVPPNSPFALTNLVMASAGVRLLPYTLGTLVGMAPRTGIAVAIAALGRASGARDIQELIEEQPWWAVPAGLLAFVVVVGIIGYIGNKALHQVTGIGAANTTAK